MYFINKALVPRSVYLLDVLANCIFIKQDLAIVIKIGIFVVFYTHYIMHSFLFGLVVFKTVALATLVINKEKLQLQCTLLCKDNHN